jgi:hypothetical protein
VAVPVARVLVVARVPVAVAASAARVPVAVAVVSPVAPAVAVEVAVSPVARVAAVAAVVSPVVPVAVLAVVPAVLVDAAAPAVVQADVVDRVEARAAVVARRAGGARSGVAITKISDRRRNGSHRPMHPSPRARSSCRAARRSRSTRRG